jgi:hypothetical protein
VDGAIIAFEIRDDASFDRLAAVVTAISDNTFPWDDEQEQQAYFLGVFSAVPQGLLGRLRDTRRECDFISCGRRQGRVGEVATDPYAYPVDTDALRSLIELFGHKAR